MQHVAEVILKAIASKPEDVVVNSSSEADRTVLTVYVNQADVGRVIGHKGRTINAVRTLVKASALKTQTQVSLDLVAPELPSNNHD